MPNMAVGWETDEGVRPSSKSLSEKDLSSLAMAKHSRMDCGGLWDTAPVKRLAKA
jgi:hypothetical protein